MIYRALLGVVELGFSVMGIPAIMNLRSLFQGARCFLTPALFKKFPEVLAINAWFENKAQCIYLHPRSPVSILQFFGAIGKNLNTDSQHLSFQ